MTSGRSDSEMGTPTPLNVPRDAIFRHAVLAVVTAHAASEAEAAAAAAARPPTLAARVAAWGRDRFRGSRRARGEDGRVGRLR